MARNAEDTNKYVKHMLSTHTLAQEIITHHNTDKAIFDDKELGILEKYCHDPTKKDSILREYGMLDEPGKSPCSAGSNVKGSLAGYVVVKDALSEHEIKILKEWFENDRSGAE